MACACCGSHAYDHFLASRRFLGHQDLRHCQDSCCHLRHHRSSPIISTSSWFSVTLPWSPIKSCTLNVLLNNVDGQCDVDNLFIAVDDPQGHVESRLRNGGKTFHGQQNGRLGIHVGGRNAFMGPGAERGLVGLKSLDSHVLELTCIKTSDGVLLAGRTRGEHV